MNFSKTTYDGSIEILAADEFKAIPVKCGAPAAGNIMKAGTPLTSAGVSTTGASAVGILLYDVDVTKNPNGAAVVEGIIDSAKAQAHSGVEYSVSDLKAALPGVYLRGNISAKQDVTALKTLSVGGATLTPAFDAAIHNYTLATSASTATVTVAVADNSNATAVIKNGDTTVTSGNAASWDEGANNLKVTVTAEDGVTADVYTVVVTYSA